MVEKCFAKRVEKRFADLLWPFQFGELLHLDLRPSKIEFLAGTNPNSSPPRCTIRRLTVRKQTSLTGLRNTGFHVHFRYQRTSLPVEQYVVVCHGTTGCERLAIAWNILQRVNESVAEITFMTFDVREGAK